MEKKFNDFTGYKGLSAARILSIYKETDTLIKSHEEDLLKSEGSKGGKVIGHTKSGKPIYESHDHPSHKEFTAADHEDAYHLHNHIAPARYGKPDNDKEKHNWDQADKHYRSSEVKGEKESDEKEVEKAGYCVEDKMMKAFDDLGLNDIEKSEGSRGGKIIGHTKSGKAVYQSKHAEDYTDFDHRDHDDAAKLHYDSKEKRIKKEGEIARRDSDRKVGSHDDASKNMKHKVGDHVIDSEGRKGKVTHADGKEVAVEHDNGDISGYEHHQVKKFTDKKETSLEEELNAVKPKGNERQVAAEDDKKRSERAKQNKEDKKKLEKSEDSDLNKAFDVLGLTSSSGEEKKN